ncbi:DmsC/YnfH family molybdoenzyme membrane anchor subunit [Mesorhizobium sp. BAC0120]|uniref:dimethyl sulfoxide reductase anchor subunit family protein n=1 Tax=Mesorhizobium sp. BAC0120 TaxID=3090670 RepID=UPI00298C5CD9|nr:DmsC/YnfH family molybdoenzyme membrane anchor subunit [Mesorhizobium sp. BAC0120]MDW6020432.1 DmsC/YnfH family molybdoenzyme membrane anchor subunit [Mesorhizobium sp. BAC0120]
MHPAFSIIVFTTLSGLGYGLAAVLGLGLLDPALLWTKVAHVLALLLISAGLMSSTLHLGNPQRAWRALTQWRSSWLSREGVMAIVTFVPLLVSAWASVVEGRYLQLPGLLGAAGAAVTVYCTAMIYASLKSVDAWHTPLTPLCYLLFGAAGGVLLGGLLHIAGGATATGFSVAAIILLAAAWGAKIAWWGRLRSLRPISTPESATGLGSIGRVRLFERPHINDNYLTREMGYRIARKHAAKLSRLAIIFGGIAPAACLVLVAVAGQGVLALLLQLLAVLLFGSGVAVERWLFFAEARHAVVNYYGG